MRNKKSLLLFAIIFLWMFNATKIIALFANKDIEIRKLDELPSEVNSSIYYWIDETTLSADLLNTISIYGWLVSQPDDAMNEKEVAIIFKSDQEIYEIPAEIFPENNVLAMLKGKGLNISNENIRFGISFSSLAMKQGVYQMFLRSRGNEGELGLVETNIFFERNNMGLEKHYAESETITAPHSMPEEKALGYGWVDSLKVQNNILYLTGWGFLDGMDSTQQQVVINIKNVNGKDEYYRAYPYSRVDLVGYESNLRSQNAGIDAVIDIGTSEISPDDITVFVINGEKWFSFKPTIEIQQL